MTSPTTYRATSILNSDVGWEEGHLQNCKYHFQLQPPLSILRDKKAAYTRDGDKKNSVNMTERPGKPQKYYIHFLEYLNSAKQTLNRMMKLACPTHQKEVQVTPSP